MIIYPAIDIMGGKVVRLKQGKADLVKVYADNPADMAVKWEAAGARIIHVVDLDGAFTGSSVNLEAISGIAEAVDIPVQLGGGMRNLEAVERAFDAGVDRVVIGTALVKDPGFAKVAFERYPGRVIAGIDAKKGKVAISGWEADTDLDAVLLAKRMEEDGAAGVVYTDIEVDGMGKGVNLAATRELAEAIGIPVIASGGVATLDDIRRLFPLESAGVTGVIVGTALYEKNFTLEEAIEVGLSAD
ncbi:MAG: 1-(5-phosphoribosyl)-5-[(5-phosphoribosylamino)methylideneamino]imidazole-4-carboxamide isomerase [Candidatus Aquicultorales bacterium]